MNEMTRKCSHLASILALAVLAACGGGGNDDADDGGNDDGGNSQIASCNTALFQPGSVEAPTSAQLTAYAGTFNGVEGNFGPNPGDPFVSTGNAVMVFGASGTLSYKGASQTPTSICIDKATGPLGRIMYVHTANAHFDISDQTNPPDLGRAWGVAPGGAVLFRNGQKQ